MPTDNQTIPYHVSGKVTDRNDMPQDGLIIRVYDRDLRSEEPIGEAITNRDGQYNLNYFPEKFLKAEKKYPDLAVKVYAPEGKQPLYEPTVKEIRFNARRREVMNIRLQREVPRGADEYSRYLRELAPLIGQVPLHQLDENEKVQDISFLTREAGIEGERLEYLVVAHRLQADFDVPATVAYGLFRMETLLRRDMKDLLRVRFGVALGDDLQTLLYDLAMLDDQKVQRDIQAAVKNRIIPPNSADDYKSAKAILKQQRKKAEEFNQKEKPRRVLNLMSGFLLTDKVSQVSELLAQSGGDMSAFVNALEEGDLFESKNDEKNAGASLLLGSLLGYNEEANRKGEKSSGHSQAGGNEETRGPRCQRLESHSGEDDRGRPEWQQSPE